MEEFKPKVRYITGANGYPNLLISRELRALGFKVGDPVKVYILGNKVIIEKFTERSNDEKGEFENLDEVVAYIIGKKCVNCGQVFDYGNFELGMYPHDGGWFVKSLNQTLWLYAVCLNCDYQNSLHKLR